MMRKGPAAGSVNAYLAMLTPKERAALQRLRKAIKSAAPKAEEGISYMMPAYKFHGALVYFGAFKGHLSFFPASKAMLQTFSRELKGFDSSGGTIRFSPEKPLPVSLVKNIVRRRLEQNLERLIKKRVKR